MTEKNSVDWDAVIETWQKASQSLINAARESAEAFGKFIEQVKEGENKNG